jgi:hypothetical protein
MSLVTVVGLETDYLVVGAGAAGMAFADALVDHADVSVVLVDRRHGVGGHWLDAYPFVRLHQASSFYGVASTLLGDGSLQKDGPEAGLHERANAPEVCAYYDRVLRTRLLASGKVRFYPNCDYLGEGRFVSRVSGRHHEVPPVVTRRHGDVQYSTAGLVCDRSGDVHTAGRENGRGHNNGIKKATSQRERSASICLTIAHHSP